MSLSLFHFKSRNILTTPGFGNSFVWQTIKNPDKPDLQTLSQLGLVPLELSDGLAAAAKVAVQLPLGLLELVSGL